MFPSPCGDYGSYLFVCHGNFSLLKVSVPLRGLWFLSTASLLSIALNSLRGFRPLAGIMVLIDADVETRGIILVSRFPSPCGDYGSYQQEKPTKMDMLF